MFFAAYRRAIRERREMAADRDFWKKRAIALEAKLEERTDFFVEREFKLLDRFLTSQVKTFAITDQIKAEQRERIFEESDVKKAAFEAFLDNQKEFLLQCAREADDPNPEDRAARTLEQNMGMYEAEFEQEYRFKLGNQQIN